MRYAVLALAVLGVLGIGVAVDWSTPSRAPVPAIELQPGPTTEAAPQALQTVKGSYGGRNLNRAPLRKVVQQAPRVTAVEPSRGTSGTTSTDEQAQSPTPAGSAQDQQQPTTGGGGRSGDDSSDDPDSNPPPGPQTPTTPTTPTAPGTPEPADEDDDGAQPAPAPPPAPAGEPTGGDDDDDDDDEDDDGGGGGGDDGGDDD